MICVIMEATAAVLKAKLIGYLEHSSVSIKLCASLVTLLLLLTAAPTSAKSEEAIPPGTVITAFNWKEYKQFMPDSMAKMLAGQFAWTIPRDFRIVIGPTNHYPPPNVYLQNTTKYGANVQIISLPNGGHSINNYIAGEPFPSPSEPLKGYKILVDSWYRYVPYLICGTDDHQYLTNLQGQMTNTRLTQVFRRLSHISDVDQPINEPRAEGADYCEYGMFTEPEQLKYTQVLTVYYNDPNRSEDDYVYIPQLRRVLRQSANGSCASMGGSDFTLDDRNGFSGGIFRFQADYLHDQQIITLTKSPAAEYGNLSNYYPIFFPKPTVGNWEVRTVYVLDVRRIPSARAGYCYGRQVMYIDQESFNILWKELYDSSMRLEKIYMGLNIASPVPREGMQLNAGNGVQAIWNLDKGHLSVFMTTGLEGKGLVANDACRSVDGVNYDDVGRFCTAGGLTQVMR